MIKLAAGIFAVVLVIAGVAIYATLGSTTQQKPQTDETGWTPSGRVMSIDDYVRQNISTLSPEKEVLGGTFYVTKIETNNGQGTVEYEDGHIALVADFTYRIDQDRGITITSFTVRK